MTGGLDELRATLAAGTPGPWTHGGDDDYAIYGATEKFVALVAPLDAALIVAAVNALPALLAVVDAAVPYLEAIHARNSFNASLLFYDLRSAVDAVKGTRA